MKETFRALYINSALLALFALLTVACTSFAQAAMPQGQKTFIDYFLPTPIIGSLSTNAWGASQAGPRDQQNGLEDMAMKEWRYWDGQILKGKDGKYHLFASRWPQEIGHYSPKRNTLAVHAVSDNLFGPYVDKGLCWPENLGGKGHNVTALILPDGRYAAVVSDSRPGDVFVSESLDGPWQYLGRIKVATNNVEKKLTGMMNVSMMVRPDGNFEIVQAHGGLMISKSGILGPYTVQDTSVYMCIPEKEAPKQVNLEDPVIWHSGGFYHVVVNQHSTRRAFHITSFDGITNWQFKGLAYDPSRDFLRYTDGTVNHWFKMERPGVVLENGHVIAMSFAVTDVEKKEQHGNDGHGSKIIVVPFDGAALDEDLAKQASR